MYATLHANTYKYVSCPRVRCTNVGNTYSFNRIHQLKLNEGKREISFLQTWSNKEMSVDLLSLNIRSTNELKEVQRK